MMDTFLVQGKHLRETRPKFGTILIFFNVAFITCLFPTCSAASACPGNQTAELGGQGYITCNFSDGFLSVHWFDNTSDISPVISFNVGSGVKSGQGFGTGLYDIDQNGSLIISNVTKWHEREYRCIVYPDHTFDVFLVSLTVIAAPGNQFPVVKCSNCYHYKEYYISLADTETLRCSYSAARPPVQLAWFEQMSDGYDYQERQLLNITENKNGTYHSIATLHSLKESINLIHLFTCRSTWPQSDWRRKKEILVDLSRNKSFSNDSPKTQHIEVSKHSRIHCGQPDSTYVVWKRILPTGEPELIGFHSHVVTETVTDIPDVKVSTEGSLIFASPQVRHEGIYVCISGDGQKEEIQMTSVELLIPPSPPYIQITGCDDVSHHCVIREDATKNLTCAVYGARPKVTLEWIAAVGDEISFFNHKEVFKESGETYDTILSAEYKVSHDIICGKMILIKCHLYGPLSNIMKAESTALVIPASCKENEVKEEHGLNGVVIAVFVFHGLFLIVIVVSLIIYCIGRHLTKSAAAGAFYNGGPTRGLEDTSLQIETEEARREIPNGTPPCIVEDTDEECGLMDSKDASVKDNQDE